MHFFRSEEHLKNWTQYDPATEEGMMPLKDLITLFLIDFFTKRLEPDYFSHLAEYMVGFYQCPLTFGAWAKDAVSGWTLEKICQENGFSFENLPVENGALLYFRAILQ